MTRPTKPAKQCPICAKRGLVGHEICDDCWVDHCEKIGNPLCVKSAIWAAGRAKAHAARGEQVDVFYRVKRVLDGEENWWDGRFWRDYRCGRFTRDETLALMCRMRRNMSPARCHFTLVKVVVWNTMTAGHAGACAPEREET